MLEVLLQRFFDSTVTNWELVVILLLPGIIYGLRRGWQEEGFTAVGLAIVVSPLGQRFADFLLLLANRMLGVFPLGVAILLNRPPEEWPRLGDDVISPDSVLVQVLLLLLMVLVAYRAGTILGRRQNVNLLGRITGAIFGAINGFLILARLLMLANPLEEGVVVDLPTVTVMGMPADRLNNIIYALIGFIIALFLLLAWMNRRRASE